jgi:putative ABC transport system ATP-binding protein
MACGPRLEVRGVSKVFDADTAEPVVALDNMTLAAEPGDLIVFVGSNGSGKTTLLNVIAGTVCPDSGSVLIDGQDVTDWPAHRRARQVARVNQSPADGTAAYLTVVENLALAAGRGHSRGLKPGVSSSLREQASKRLAAYGIGVEGKQDTQARLLSGGQRQAVALLMATWAAPSVLLLDEHTSALDPRAAEKVLSATLALAKSEETAILMVTHNLALAASAASCLFVMNRGAVIGCFAKAELDDLRPSDIVDLLVASGAQPPRGAFLSSG